MILRFFFRFAGLMALTAVLLTAFSAKAALVPVSGVKSFTEARSFGGVQRNALYIHPKTYSTTAAPVPLMVILHPRGSTGEQVANQSMVMELVRDFGIFVILPNAVGGDWADDPSETGRADDMGYITSLISGAATRFPVDSRKVYLMGYSDGGQMTARYVCEKPAKIAAAGTIASSIKNSLNRVCNPSRATPVIMINGTGDQLSPYAGMVGLMSAPDAAARWAQINGCRTTPPRTSLLDLVADGTNSYMDEYTTCASGGSVALYTVVNGGHVWPGSPFNAAVFGLVSQDFDATYVIWDFVKRFVR
ncbi:MAG: alpha/beta hydrolase family esterase [Panacagrimonas sp.]